jgi:hypothetical protein
MNRIIGVLGLVAMMLSASGVSAADDTLESQAPLIVMSQAILTTANASSSEFYLSRSVNFSVEVSAISTQALDYDMKFEFYGSDSAWHDDPDGVFLDDSTLVWNAQPVILPYWTRKLRVNFLNNSSYTTTPTITIHRDSHRRP